MGSIGFDQYRAKFDVASVAFEELLGKQQGLT